MYLMSTAYFGKYYGTNDGQNEETRQHLLACFAITNAGLN